MTGRERPLKRGRADELFFDSSDPDETGAYLKVALRSGKPLKSRGWPWIQACIRGILVGPEKVEKASLLADGSLLVRTKTQRQTEKFLKATHFGEEECEVVRDSKLNQSRGTVHAYDLMELSDSEVVGWLKDFGVVGAKRFTRKTNGMTENTPTILLTFDRPICPKKLELDYITYHVNQYVPNPLMCFKCGRFGHPEVRCTREKICLRCGKKAHEGECELWCVNCEKPGHACSARECEVWMKEKEICRIKTEQDVSYPQARKLYDDTHPSAPTNLRSFASVVRQSSVMNKQEEELRDKVERLETKVSEMITLMKELLSNHHAAKDKESDASLSTETHKQGAVTDDLTRDRPLTNTADGGEMIMVLDSDQHCDHACEGMGNEDDPQTQAVSEAVVGSAPSLKQGPGKAGQWRSTKTKTFDKHQNKVLSDEDITPSPVLNRPSRSLERTKRNNQRRSWADT